MNANEYLAVGARVITANFGVGTVVKLLPYTAIVRLDMHGQPSIVQPHALLSPLSTAAEQARSAGPPGTMRRVPRETGTVFVRQRQAIEALRFGLVPHHSLDDLTLGYDTLHEWTRHRLPESHGGAPQASAVFGPFGTGKSHTMAVIRHAAERLGYLTAHVEVDGKTLSLAEPERLLHALWGTLRGTDFASSTPLVDLYLRAIKAGRSAPTVAPQMIDRTQSNYMVVSSLHEHGMIDDYSHIIEGILSSSNEYSASEVRRLISSEQKTLSGVNLAISRVIGNALIQRPYDFVGSLAGNATIAQLAGFRGLVITIDEFEVEQSQSTVSQRYRISQLLSVVQAYLRGETGYQPAPLALFFATVGATGHIGDSVIEQLVDTAPDAGYFLEPWSTHDVRDLAQRIHRLYCAAYEIHEEIDIKLINRVMNDIETYTNDDSGMIRAFIKRYTAALDTHYGPPQPV